MSSSAGLSALPGAPAPDHHTLLSRRLRRVGLVVFFASVAINALIGIAALLVPHPGEHVGKVLGTSVTVTVAVLAILVCAPALERRAMWPVPLVAVVSVLVTFALFQVVIWSTFASDSWGNALGTVAVVAVASVLLCVLALARLAPRFRVVMLATTVLTLLAAAMVIVAIWVQPSGTPFGRLLGVVMVLLAAGVVSMPVLHRISAPELRQEALAGVDVGYCPFCGHGIEPLEVGAHGTCPACHREFAVQA
ncbi:MAG TPA: hypothetical protein VMI11_06380 [Actinomycetes bacterium]|nr:hypothetical protein [Actinomycetes bacterium]